jgi:hypothetical protein
MSLHIIKLCVGVESVEDLEGWIDGEVAALRAAGQPAVTTHTTRMMPKRADEIVGEGSLYWVIKGFVQVRQRIVDIRPVTDAAGIERCDIVLDPQLHRTRLQPRRPFQGWRYLADRDAPADLGRTGTADDAIPAEMRRELAELGLI